MYVPKLMACKSENHLTANELNNIFGKILMISLPVFQEFEFCPIIHVNLSSPSSANLPSRGSAEACMLDL